MRVCCVERLSAPEEIRLRYRKMSLFDVAGKRQKNLPQHWVELERYPVSEISPVKEDRKVLSVITSGNPPCGGGDLTISFLHPYGGLTLAGLVSL